VTAEKDRDKETPEVVAVKISVRNLQNFSGSLSIVRAAKERPDAWRCVDSTNPFRLTLTNLFFQIEQISLENPSLLYVSKNHLCPH
jgi:hypothetical protein